MSILPIIPVSDLQRSAKRALADVKDYAVVQSHGKDRAFILHPDLGKVLLESGMLEWLKTQAKGVTSADPIDKAAQLKGLIGGVLRELSKR